LTEGVDGEGTQSGLGATEIGVKWRFVDHAGIEAAVYPQYSFDDGFTVVDAEGLAEASPVAPSICRCSSRRSWRNVYTVAANFGYRMNVDTDDDDLDVALGVGRAVGSTGRVLAELFSERDTHFDNRQTDVRVGYAQSLYKSWLAGFASIGTASVPPKSGSRRCRSRSASASSRNRARPRAGGGLGEPGGQHPANRGRAGFSRAAGSRRRAAGCERDVFAPRRAAIDLPRPGDLALRIEQRFLPLRQPADDARDREQHREHLEREPIA
jgi:hypothetical protein